MLCFLHAWINHYAQVINWIFVDEWKGQLYGYHFYASLVVPYIWSNKPNIWVIFLSFLAAIHMGPGAIKLVLHFSYPSAKEYSVNISLDLNGLYYLGFVQLVMIMGTHEISWSYNSHHKKEVLKVFVNRTIIVTKPAIYSFLADIG